MNKQTIGTGLLVSAAIAIFLMVVITVATTPLDPDGGYEEWHYAASWVNGVLAFHAWTAFWAGLKLRLTTRDRFAHILVLVVMTVGIVSFAFAGFSEITK